MIGIIKRLIDSIQIQIRSLGSRLSKRPRGGKKTPADVASVASHHPQHLPPTSYYQMTFNPSLTGASEDRLPKQSNRFYSLTQ